MIPHCFHLLPNWHGHHISGQIHPHYWWLSNNSCWTNSYVWRLIPDSNPKSLGIPWKNVHFFTSSYPFKNIPKRARSFRRKSGFAPWSHPIILLWKPLSGSCPEMWLKAGEMGILVWKMSPKSGVKQWITGFFLNPQWGEDCPWLVVATVFKEINAGWWYTYPPEKWWTSSIGIIFPNWMESHKIHVPNHQPNKYE